MEGYLFDEHLLLISEDGANLLARSTPIAFSIAGKTWVNNHAHVLRFTDKKTQFYVQAYLNSISIEGSVTGSALPKLNQNALNRTSIPMPFDLEARRKIVTDLEAERALVEPNRELLSRFERKVESTMARIWGRAEPAVQPLPEAAE